MEEELLSGGVANAGAVVRVGGDVLRPSNPHTPSVHVFLRSLRKVGFTGASEPVGVESDGRERLHFIPGQVPLPPYPEWAQTDEVLASTASLLSSLHQAAASFDPSPLPWSSELADPEGGVIVCHNDVCLENVVFEGGTAVAFVDFDFAAPGRPIWDLASFARMCVPVDDEINASRNGWIDPDRPARLRTVADAYGVAPSQRAELLGILDLSIERGGTFVRRRVEAGDPNFVAMWNAMGGAERFDRRRRWWARERDRFEAGLA